jgi:hypothetical protein
MAQAARRHRGDRNRRRDRHHGWIRGFRGLNEELPFGLRANFRRPVRNSPPFISRLLHVICKNIGPRNNDEIHDSCAPRLQQHVDKWTTELRSRANVDVYRWQ